MTICRVGSLAARAVKLSRSSPGSLSI